MVSNDKSLTLHWNKKKMVKTEKKRFGDKWLCEPFIIPQNGVKWIGPKWLPNFSK